MYVSVCCVAVQEQHQASLHLSLLPPAVTPPLQLSRHTIFTVITERNLLRWSSNKQTDHLIA